MENIKKGLLAVAAVLAGLMCMGGIFSLTMLLRYADFKQGKAIIIVIFLLMIAGFGVLSFKCFKSVFRKKGMPKSEKVVNFTVEEQMPDLMEDRYVQSVDETPANPVVEKETENNTVFGVPVKEIKIMPREEPQEASQLDKTGGFNREKYHSTDNKNHTSEGFKAINAQAYADVQQEYDFLVCHVRYNRTLHDNIPFSFEEEVFFKALIKEMKENKLWNKEGLRLTRLADYTFNVDCHTCYIGKVKLRNKMFIQVQRGSSQIKKYNISELSEVLDKIPAWIRYIKYCRKD